MCVFFLSSFLYSALVANKGLIMQWVCTYQIMKFSIIWKKCNILCNLNSDMNNCNHYIHNDYFRIPQGILRLLKSTHLNLEKRI